MKYKELIKENYNIIFEKYISLVLKEYNPFKNIKKSNITFFLYLILGIIITSSSYLIGHYFGSCKVIFFSLLISFASVFLLDMIIYPFFIYLLEKNKLKSILKKYYSIIKETDEKNFLESHKNIISLLLRIELCDEDLLEYIKELKRIKIEKIIPQKEITKLELKKMKKVLESIIELIPSSNSSEIEKYKKKIKLVDSIIQEKKEETNSNFKKLDRIFEIKKELENIS